MYLNGRGVEKSDAKALQCFEKAAVKGDGVAQYCLGVMYEYGQGIKENSKIAIGCYRKSAVRGYIDAQLRLAEIHLKGKGVEKSNTKALQWYTGQLSKEVKLHVISLLHFT